MEFLPTKVVKAAADVTDAELVKMAREQEHFAIELYARQAHWSHIRDLFDPLLRIVDIEVNHQRSFERLYEIVLNDELKFICPFCGEILDSQGRCWACGLNFASLVAKGAK